MKNFILYIIAIIFIIGLIFYCTNSRTNSIENFQNKNNNVPCGNKIPKKNCPNVLMKKDDKIYLYNANLARVPGINPVVFESLEEYVEFYEWQKSQNIDCPVLFLDTTYDTQNNEIYKVTQNPFQQPEVTLQTDLVRPGSKYIHPLVNANRSGMLAPYNQGPKIPADYDPDNQYIGLMTPLDKMFVSNSSVSANPMDPQWGGHSFTQAKIDEGVYQKDEVRNPKLYGKDRIDLLGQVESNHNINNLKGTGKKNKDDKQEKKLDSAMENNWVGADQANRDIARGLFEGDEVSIWVGDAQ